MKIKSHIEGPSTAFGTAMNYVAARLLGADADHPTLIKARGTLHKLGLYFSCYASAEIYEPQAGRPASQPGVNFGFLF
jgi:hypothetical protein